MYCITVMCHARARAQGCVPMSLQSQVFEANSVCAPLKTTCPWDRSFGIMSVEYSSSYGTVAPMSSSASSTAEETPDSEYALSVLEFAQQQVAGAQSEVCLVCCSRVSYRVLLLPSDLKSALTCAVRSPSFKQTQETTRLSVPG